MEAQMKGSITRIALAGAIALTLGACSSMTTVAERDTYAEPKWYNKCKQIGTEGKFLFWGGTDYVYACGKGVSWSDQAAVAQAKTFAYKGIAERIHSNVEASTVVDIKDQGKNTRTYVEHIVDNTMITSQYEDEKFTFKMGGEYHTFFRVKMERATFDSLITQAKNGN